MPAKNNAVVITLPQGAVTKRVLSDTFFHTEDEVTQEAIAALVAALAKREWTIDHILSRLDMTSPVCQVMRRRLLEAKLATIEKEAVEIRNELNGLEVEVEKEVAAA
jgi:hypothetical protein